MKSENGMTFSVLIIIVAVILALVYALIFFFGNEYNEEKFDSVRTDMLSIQGKVKLLAENSVAKKDVTLKKGLKLSENEEDQKVKWLLENGIISKEENYDNYYILNKDTLNELGLGTIQIEEGDYVIVNYTTHEVIYTQGIKIDNNEYFKLSDLNKIQEEKQIILNEEALKKEQEANPQPEQSQNTEQTENEEQPQSSEQQPQNNEQQENVEQPQNAE